MQRYFLTNKQLTPTNATIVGSDIHHITNVMRFQRGNHIIVCNEKRQCYRSTITSIEAHQVVVTLDELLPDTELPMQVDIAQGLIRRERFEYVIQKSMELGAHRIIPLNTKRTIVKTSQQKQNRKVQRWNTIAKEACEQAHRTKQGIVTPPQTLQEIRMDQYDHVLVAYEQVAGKATLAQVLQDTFKKILVVVGPEGGFDDSEIAYLTEFPNVSLIGLGKRILRSETASSYILSVLSYQYEMMNI